MADALAGSGADAAANRDLWTQVNAEYADEHAFRAWAAEEITWGVFNVPEAELGVLGDVSGQDVVELGCGTAYLSAWLAKRGARPVGVDLTPAELDTARRCQQRFGICFPLVEADAGDLTSLFRSAGRACGAIRLGGCPKRPGCCGQAAGWCSRRPVSCSPVHPRVVLLTLCTPECPGPAGQELLRPQRDITRMRSPGHGAQFHPSHGEWIKLLGAAGFTVDALHELYAPPRAATHPYYDLATAQWAAQWPVEELWAAHLPVSGASSGG